MDFVSNFFGRAGFLPHGYCFTWTPEVLWAMVGADALIAASYFSIPMALASFVRRRGETGLNGLLWLFSAFIFACGTTHVMDVWTIWRPDYGSQALTKLVTAAISVVTAVAIWPLIPKALRIPSVDQLQNVIASLETEVGRRSSAEDNLADTQESLAITLDSIGAGFLATDREGRITRMNPAAERITGWPLAEARGQDFWTVWQREGIPADYRAMNPVDLMQRQGFNLEQAHNVVAIARDGRTTPVEVKASLTRGSDAGVRGMAFVIRDLTEQRRTEALRLDAIRLESENRQFQEANRIKSEFLANMSHELRTPLNAIIGFADILRAGMVPADSPKGQEFLGHIGGSGRHLLQLINDVLDLSKVESGTFEFFPEAVDLERVVGEVSGILRTEAERKGLALSSDIGAGPEPVVLDPSRLKQVLYNFMSNAIKFTPAGGRITVRARAEGEAAVRIEVEDNGIGIAEADLAKLFVQFSQVHGGYAKPHQGTGLGLALTRRLAELQGGSVGVRSRLGEGSVFHIVLPRVAKFEPRAQAPLPALGSPQNAPTILVIEDDAADQSQIARTLADAGYRVQLATTGEQAMHLAASQAYSAITLDLVLPDHSGLEVLAEIRRAGPNHDTPVVVITMVTERTALAGFQVADVIAKPMHAGELASVLRRNGVQPAAGARLLVIDDDPAALALMQATLGVIGVEAVCRQDGRLALDELDRIRPDALVLDLMMPGFDGFQVLQALRGLPHWQHLPVFVWTAMALTPSELASLARSARSIVAKGDGGLATLLEALRRDPLPRRASTEAAT